MTHHQRAAAAITAAWFLGGLAAQGQSTPRTAKLVVTTTANKVERYEISEDASAQTELSANLTFSPDVPVPLALALGPGGELFVTSAQDNGGGVHVFTKPGDTPGSGQTITGADLKAPHWAAFSGDELFIAQRDGTKVSRYDVVQKAFKDAIVDNILPRTPRGVAISHWGELFVSLCCEGNRINRYRFKDGKWVYKESISDASISNPHDLVFRGSQLFIASTGKNSLVRVTFDGTEDRAATEVRSFTSSDMSSPLGLAFSPWGELFVANAGSRYLLRWAVDGEPAQRGKIGLPTALRDAEFLPEGGSLPSLRISLTGAAAGQLICENLTSGEVRTVKNPTMPLDCKAAGLPIRSGDSIQVHVSGTVQ